MAPLAFSANALSWPEAHWKIKILFFGTQGSFQDFLILVLIENLEMWDVRRMFSRILNSFNLNCWPKRSDLHNPWKWKKRCCRLAVCLHNKSVKVWKHSHLSLQVDKTMSQFEVRRQFPCTGKTHCQLLALHMYCSAWAQSIVVCMRNCLKMPTENVTQTWCCPGIVQVSMWSHHWHAAWLCSGLTRILPSGLIWSLVDAADSFVFLNQITTDFSGIFGLSLLPLNYIPAARAKPRIMHY